MNILKIQQDVLKAMLADPQSVKTYNFGIVKDYTFLTVSGTVGWVVPTNSLRVNISGAQLCMDMALQEIIEDVNELVGTDEYRIQGTARRYIRKDDPFEDVYVDTGLLKYFDKPKLYQQGGHYSNPIAVTEDIYGTGEFFLVGVVFPIKVKKQ